MAKKRKRSVINTVTKAGSVTRAAANLASATFNFLASRGGGGTSKKYTKATTSPAISKPPTSTGGYYQPQPAAARPFRSPVAPIRVKPFQVGHPAAVTIEPQRLAAQHVRDQQNYWLHAVHAAGQRLKKQFGGLKGAKRWLPLGHKNLGPLGDFGDDLVCEIRADPVLNGRSLPAELNPTSLRAIIRNEWYMPLRTYAYMVIEKYTPIETGELQRAMKAKFDEGERTIDGFPNRPVTINLGTPGVPYAKPVNKMPRSWLQHFGNKLGRRSRSPLYDPTAHEGYYSLCLRDIINKGKTLWQNEVIANRLRPMLAPLKQVGLLTNIDNELHQLFKVRFGTKIWK